jgi:hypothetical protein
MVARPGAGARPARLAETDLLINGWSGTLPSLAQRPVEGGEIRVVRVTAERRWDEQAAHP